MHCHPTPGDRRGGATATMCNPILPSMAICAHDAHIAIQLCSCMRRRRPCAGAHSTHRASLALYMSARLYTPLPSLTLRCAARPAARRPSGLAQERHSRLRPTICESRERRAVAAVWRLAALPLLAAPASALVPSMRLTCPTASTTTARASPWSTLLARGMARAERERAKPVRALRRGM